MWMNLAPGHIAAASAHVTPRWPNAEPSPHESTNPGAWCDARYARASAHVVAGDGSGPVNGNTAAAGGGAGGRVEGGAAIATMVEVGGRIDDEVVADRTPPDTARVAPSVVVHAPAPTSSSTSATRPGSRAETARDDTLRRQPIPMGGT